MPKSTIIGDDEYYDLPEDAKKKFIQKLLDEAKQYLGKDARKRQEIMNRVNNLKRRKSKKAQHHKKNK